MSSGPATPGNDHFPKCGAKSSAVKCAQYSPCNSRISSKFPPSSAKCRSSCVAPSHFWAGNAPRVCPLRSVTVRNVPGQTSDGLASDLGATLFNLGSADDQRTRQTDLTLGTGATHADGHCWPPDSFPPTRLRDLTISRRLCQWDVATRSSIIAGAPKHRKTAVESSTE